MRLLAVRRAFVGLAVTGAAAASGCVPVYHGSVDVVRLDPEAAAVQVVRVDPEEMAERALIGGVLGAALGTGLGATFAINPGLGAVIGVEAGAAIGAAIGAATTPPLPSYAPVAIPAAAVIPGFYDTWPPGYGTPPAASQVPPPPPG